MKRKGNARPWQIGAIALIALVAKVVNTPRSVDHVERIDVHFIQAAPHLGEEHFAIVPDGDGFALQHPSTPATPTAGARTVLSKADVRDLVDALEDDSGSQLIVSDVIYNRLDPYALRRSLTAAPAGSPCTPEQWQAAVAAELDPPVAGRTVYRMTDYAEAPSSASPWLEVRLQETGKPVQVWWSVSLKPLMQPWTTGAIAGVLDPRRRTAAAPRWALGAGDVLRKMLPETSLTARQLGLGRAFDDVRSRMIRLATDRCGNEKPA